VVRLFILKIAGFGACIQCTTPIRIGGWARETFNLETAMSYARWKREVYQIARSRSVTHMLPNLDILASLWERGTPPVQVVDEHCTIAAQRARHGLPPTTKAIRQDAVDRM
jgi:hypothetical protein